MRYSGTPLLRPPFGKENLAFIEEGCPYLSGKFEQRQILWDITTWPFYRERVVTVVVKRGSTV